MRLLKYVGWVTKRLRNQFNLLFYKNLKKITERILNKVKAKGFNGYYINDDSDICEIKDFLNSQSSDFPQFSEILKDLASLETIFNHKKIADRQRLSYEFMKNNLPEDYLFIEFDYKQKVRFYLHKLVPTNIW